MDEANRQLIGEVRTPLPVRPGQIAKYDSEYRRERTANSFLPVEPLARFRTVQVTDRPTRRDWAKFVRHLLDGDNASAQTLVLVMDNLNTHTIGSLYETFVAPTARALSQRLKIHDTPKQGNWLNMAETELSVLCRQCLDRRLDDPAKMSSEIAAWETSRNEAQSTIDWHFTTAAARIELRKLDP